MVGRKQAQGGVLGRFFAPPGARVWALSLLGLGLLAPSSTQADEESAVDGLRSWVSYGDGATLAYRAIVSPRPSLATPLLELAQRSASRRGKIEEHIEVLHALLNFMDGPRRLEVLQNLRLMTEPAARLVAEVAAPSTSSREEPTDYLDRRLRMSALLSLVQSNDRISLSHVLSQALLPEGVDPWARAAARKALSTHPHLERALAELQPLLSLEQLDELTQKREVAQLVSLAELIALGQSNQPKYAFHAEEIARALRFKETVLKNPKNKLVDGSDLLSPNEWRRVLHDSPLWALRTAALLHPHLPRQVQIHAETVSETYKTRKDDLGHAARWYLRIENPEKRKEPTSASTRSLWTRYAESQAPALVSALCARFSAADTRLSRGTLSSPDLSQVRLWLANDDPEHRAACAAGLSESRSRGALPLLIDRYFVEHDAQVRTAVVHGLVRYLGMQHPLIRSIARIDADSACREVASGRLSGSNLGFVVTQTHRAQTIISRTGKIHTLAPLSDGFAAVVDPAL